MVPSDRAASACRHGRHRRGPVAYDVGREARPTRLRVVHGARRGRQARAGSCRTAARARHRGDHADRRDHRPPTPGARGVHECDPAVPRREHPPRDPGDRARGEHRGTVRPRCNAVPAGDRARVGVGSRPDRAHRCGDPRTDGRDGRAPHVGAGARRRSRPALGPGRGNLRRVRVSRGPARGRVRTRGAGRPRATALPRPGSISWATRSRKAGSTTRRCSSARGSCAKSWPSPSVPRSPKPGSRR